MRREADDGPERRAAEKSRNGDLEIGGDVVWHELCWEEDTSFMITIPWG